MTMPVSLTLQVGSRLKGHLKCHFSSSCTQFFPTEFLGRQDAIKVAVSYTNLIPDFCDFSCPR